MSLEFKHWTMFFFFEEKSTCICINEQNLQELQKVQKVKKGAKVKTISSQAPMIHKYSY